MSDEMVRLYTGMPNKNCTSVFDHVYIKYVGKTINWLKVITYQRETKEDKRSGYVEKQNDYTL